MTEAEWLSCDVPRLALHFLSVSPNTRKCRLFAAGSCRRIEHLITRFKGALRAVVLAERIADGMAPTDEALNLRQRLLDQAFGWIDGYREGKENNVLYHAGHAAADCLAGIGGPLRLFAMPGGSLMDVPESAALAAAHWRRRNDRERRQEQWVQAELAAQMPLVHCVFGNPFRPITLDPSWLTSDVVALAKGIYEERAFDRMPILADALQDAGCDNDDILNHCRGPGPHVRGCWVVDLVIGKS